MKAAIVETPGVLTVREIAPPLVGEYDALCRMLYGATCSGTDLHLIGGKFPWPVQYPTILGHESIGRVTEVGARVRHLKVGDLVTRVGTTPPVGSGLEANWGGFAEWGVARDYRAMQEDGLPEAEWQPYRINQLLPPDTDPAAATMMITWRETLSYFKRMGMTTEQSLLVIGTGGNGLAFAAHAANAGFREVAMIGQASRERVAEAVGATEFFDYKAPDLDEQIAARCPTGFDFVIDAVGKQGQLSKVLPHVKTGGAVAMYGLDDYGAITLDVSQARGTFTYYVGGYDEAEVHDEVVVLMRSGKLNAALWLNLAKAFSLEEIEAAFDAVRDRSEIKALVRLMPSTG